MMRSKEIILGMCFFHFFLLMSIGVVAADGEDEAVSESNHQKNNSSQDITENINNTPLLNVSSSATLAPTLPQLQNDTSPISNANKNSNAPNTTHEPLGQSLAVSSKTKAENNTGEEKLIRGWIFDGLSKSASKVKCKLTSKCDTSKNGANAKQGDNAEGPIDIRLAARNPGENKEETPILGTISSDSDDQKARGWIQDWVGETASDVKCKFFDCPSSSFNNDFVVHHGDDAQGMIDVKTDIHPKLKHSLGTLDISA